MFDTGTHRCNDARHRLSPDDVWRFHEDGFLSPLRLWSPSETASIRALIERHVFPNGPQGTPAPDVSFARTPELVELFRRPALVEPIASILGQDLFLWCIKPLRKRAHDPRAMAVPWYQDRVTWPLEPMVACSVWLAVDDVTLENGCMQVIPGSHRKIEPRLASPVGASGPVPADPDCVDTASARPLVLRAGEFALFNERLLQSSEINRSDRDRLGLAIRVLPALVRVMEFDSDDHELVQLRGSDPLGFNRVRRDETTVAA